MTPIPMRSGTPTPTPTPAPMATTFLLEVLVFELEAELVVEPELDDVAAGLLDAIDVGPPLGLAVDASDV